MFGLLWQLGCFFQTQALGHSLRSNGQALGQSGAAACPLQGGRMCLLGIGQGVWMEGPFGSLIGGGFCSAPARRLQ